MKTIKWLSVFLAGLAAGGGLGAGVLAEAAVGDLIYEVHESANITGAQAATAADAFIAAGAWSGNRADMIRCAVERDGGSSTGFRAYCVGLKSAAPNALPVTDAGVRVVGQVE